MDATPRSPGFVLAACIVCLVSPSIADDNSLPAPISDYPAFYCYLEDVDGELSGYVEMTFTVTTEGDVRDPVVSRSEVCLGLEAVIPRIETIAVETLLDGYRYRPRVVDGEAVEVPDVTTRILFLYDPRGRDDSHEDRSFDSRQSFLDFVRQYAEERPDSSTSTEGLRFRMFAD